MLLPKATGKPLDGVGKASITKQVDRAHERMTPGIAEAASDDYVCDCAGKDKQCKAERQGEMRRQNIFHSEDRGRHHQATGKRGSHHAEEGAPWQFDFPENTGRDRNSDEWKA